MAIIDGIIAELDQEAAATRRVLERVPEDKLTWKPHPKSMSLGQLALHIATCNGAIANIASQDTFEMMAFQQPEAKTKAEILDAFDKGLAQAKQLLTSVDDARAMAAWSMTKQGSPIFSLPRIGMYRAIMCNHQYHHRGQLTVYLRLLDVALPSVYGPSADENPFG
ncbi:MAG: DinB family protein [Bryobacteraceae bacterium]